MIPQAGPTILARFVLCQLSESFRHFGVQARSKADAGLWDWYVLMFFLLVGKDSCEQVIASLAELSRMLILARLESTLSVVENLYSPVHLRPL